MSCRTSWNRCGALLTQTEWIESAAQPSINEQFVQLRTIVTDFSILNVISDRKLTSSKAIAELFWKRIFRCAVPSDATGQKQTRIAVDR